MSTAFQRPPSTGPDYQRQPRKTRRLRSSAHSNGDESNLFQQLGSSENLERYLEDIRLDSAMGAFAPQTPPQPAFWPQEQDMPRNSMSSIPLMHQYPNWASSQARENGEQHTAPFAQPPRASRAPTAAPGAVPGQLPDLYVQRPLNDSPRGLSAGLVEPSPPNSLLWGPNGTIISDWAHTAHNGLRMFDQNSIIGEGRALNPDFSQRMVLNPGQIHLPSPSQSIQSVGSTRDASPIPSDTEKPWACEKCPARFSRKRDTERHMRSVHTGEAPYFCKGCKEGFVRSDARGRHWKLDPGCRVLHQGVEDLETSRSRPRMSK